MFLFTEMQPRIVVFIDYIHIHCVLIQQSMSEQISTNSLLHCMCCVLDSVNESHRSHLSRSVAIHLGRLHRMYHVPVPTSITVSKISSSFVCTCITFDCRTRWTFWRPCKRQCEIESLNKIEQFRLIAVFEQIFRWNCCDWMIVSRCSI